MRARVSTVSIVWLASAGLAQANCVADNCLRALRATQTPGRLEAAQSFCSTFTAATATVTAIPTYATDACKANQNGDVHHRLSSACSCIAASTTSSATSTPTAACALVSSSWAAQKAAAPSATPTVLASLAYECLSSVPLGKEAGIELVDALVPYMEWQSDAAYKANPPADYPYPAYDMFGNLAFVRAKLENNEYPNEYEFEADLYMSVFAPGHDGHFLFYPDGLVKGVNFVRNVPLVSISEDGLSLPVIKVYNDVISNPKTASVVTHINGIDAAKFVEDLMRSASYNQDIDSAYNTAFFSLAHQVSGYDGFFAGLGRVNHVYHGSNTTMTFANGTELTIVNMANVVGDFTGVVDGASYYTKFCTPTDASASALAAEEADIAKVVGPGYPEPVHTTNDSIVSCYYLDGEGVENVLVIALLAMESESIPEFQSVVQQCIADGLKAGKTKLVVDFQANGGGYILLGYDFYRQLFPHIQEDGFSRWKGNDGFIATAKIDSDLVENLNPYTSDNADLVGDYETWFNYKYDYNETLQPFLTWEDKFAPHVYENTKYTNIMRWNLNDNLTTINSTYGMGIWISGYGALSNLTQPFAAEDIVLLYDGICASTCTIASEMLRIQGGVKSIAMGGRPIHGPIQGVGGVKGSQNLQFSDVYAYMTYAAQYAENDEQKAALARYTTLPMQRSTSAGVNVRDAVLRPNLEDGVPAQFVNEPADCRLYWTAPMLSDATEVWKAAANAAFNGAPCAYGGIAKPASQSSKRHPHSVVKNSAFAPRVAGEKRDNVFRRSAAQNNSKWNARFRMKATPW